MNHIKPNNDTYHTHDSTDLPWVESPFFYDILERYRHRFTSELYDRAVHFHEEGYVIIDLELEDDFINAEQSGGQVQFNMAGTFLGRFHEYGLAVGRGIAISTAGPFNVFAPSATHNQNDAIIHMDKGTNVGNDRFIHARQTDSGSLTVRGRIRINSGQNNLEFESSSDRRIKQDIADLTGAIDKIKELKPRTFKFKEDPSRGTFAGLIAQELNEVFPTWVTKTDDGTGDTVPTEKNEFDKDEDQPWTIGTDALQFYLVGALKEAITKIETLETSNADLITRVKALEDA